MKKAISLVLCLLLINPFLSFAFAESGFTFDDNLAKFIGALKSYNCRIINTENIEGLGNNINMLKNKIGDNLLICHGESNSKATIYNMSIYLPSIKNYDLCVNKNNNSEYYAYPEFFNTLIDIIGSGENIALEILDKNDEISATNILSKKEDLNLICYKFKFKNVEYEEKEKYEIKIEPKDTPLYKENQYVCYVGNYLSDNTKYFALCHRGKDFKIYIYSEDGYRQYPVDDGHKLVLLSIGNSIRLCVDGYKEG